MIIDGKNVQIFACSSGTGKTTFAKLNPNFIDIDREKYFCKYPNISKSISDKDLENLKDKVLNKSREYPENFKNLIKEYINQGKNLLVVPEPLIMDIINSEKLAYVLIYPSIDCKEEYKQRLIDRGNSIEFTSWHDMFFDKYVKQCEDDTNAFKKFKLKSGEFVSDVINSLNK